ncbi:MAG: glycosyltransferase family 4 protein [Planctomycetota bacterium]|jgi:glycosyltransferase involved in cell wall biosynthesis|nr:glycosyltransferase family 4 protein [Planctomycetota bacterium]MDP6941064.1 glycosyltransferase family 4 protein [Planctomycetota bacterium]
MNILVAYRGLPWPITEGYHLRILHLFRHLAEAGHKVHLLSLIHQPEQERGLAHLEAEGIFSSIHRMRMPSRNWIGRLYSNMGLDPAQSLLSEYPGFSGAIQAKVKSLKLNLGLDVAFVFDPWVEVLFCDARFELPSLVDICDCRSLYYERQLESRELSFAKRIRTRQLLKRFRGIESFALANYPIAAAVSDEDAHYLQSLWPSARIEVIPNGVDLEQFQADEDSLPIPGRMILFGNMDFLPNVDSATRSAKELLPAIQEHVREAHLVIVGTNPLPEVVALDSIPGVEVVGAVEDMAPWISSSQLLLAPMRFGAGIKNKVLETFACERPVVTTPRAGGALHPEAVDLLRGGESDQELVQAASALLRDPEGSHHLGVIGRKVMRRHHSWGAAAARYGELLAELATTECSTE